MTLKIIYKDQDIVVVNKAAGWLSVPGREGEKDTRPVVGLELQKELKTQIFPVHRLDFEVSGVLIFALNAKTHKSLNQAFEQGLVKKTYKALTEKKEGAALFDVSKTYEWKSKIVRGKKRSFFADYGKEALTLAHLIRVHEDGTYEWKLNPVTGRSHQLRLELASRGYPILGDKLYGSTTTTLPAHEISLQCIEIELPKGQKWNHLT